MPKKSIKLYSLHIPVLILVAAIVGVGAYFGNQGVPGVDQGATLGSKSNNSKPSKSPGSQNSSNSNKDVVTKDNIEKGNSTNIKYSKAIDSLEHKENISKVVKELKNVATSEEELGNTEISYDLEEVASDEEENAEEAVEVISELESRSKWQQLLLGTDYKNLGQLRSTLARNENNIRKLSKISESVSGEDSGVQVQEQLQAMTQERERIMNVIKEQEQQFSILGWVFKLFNGYKDVPIEEIGDSEEEVIEDGTVDTGSTVDTDEIIDTDSTLDTSSTSGGDEAAETETTEPSTNL